MTKWQLDRDGGPWDYPTLGFSAVDGAIIDGSLSNPVMTDPPDGYWTEYVGGSAETGVTRWGELVHPPAPAEPTEGSVYVYRADDNRGEWANGEDVFASGTSLGDALSATIGAALADNQTLIDAAVAAMENLDGSALGDLGARIDGYEDHGDVSGAVTFSGPTGSHWFDATGPTTITLDGYEEGQVVSLLPFSGASDVTVNYADNLALTDGLIASAMLARGVWVTGGGGEPVVPDATPPAAITDLSATGGESEMTLTGTNPTDAESTARIRYRVWLTSGGATGAWLTATSFPIVVTGLAAGAYTAEVYAYSGGGASATDTATATVTAPPGWHTIVLATFTGADGAISGTYSPDIGDDLAAAGAILIANNALEHSTHSAAGTLTATLDDSSTYSASSFSLRQTVDYDLTVDPAGSVPSVRLASNYHYLPGTTGYYAGSGWQVRAERAASTMTVTLDVYNWDTAYGTLPVLTALSGKALTGHPLAGTFSVEHDATTNTTTVYVDGIATATANWGTAPVGNRIAVLNLSNRHPLADNWRVETYS